VNAYLIDWLSLLGRWVHLITGIAWIGASFYFVWLDNHLLFPADEAATQKGVGGELWSVHGGGFYHAQKYKVAPQSLPRSLHWFYWEAYSTFLSGFFLLALLYYAQAEVYLIDPQVMPLSKPAAIAIGVGFIVCGWLVYDFLCRSALRRDGAALGGLLALILSAAAFALCHVFSGRGAFIEFGAMLGAIMVANVFFVIIPAQRQMVQAKREGREPDPAVGARGKLRSVHNTYFTLPVLFTMISNHYAVTFSAHYNWLVLIALSAGGALIRAYFVERHKRHERSGRTSPWTMVLGLCIIAATAAALAPHPRAQRSSAQTPGEQFATVEDIVNRRCVPCHASAPSQPGFSAPPKGLVLETADDLLSHLSIVERQIATRAMPIANLTQMTDTERDAVLDWIHRGAPR
jgi:uncharacterized membrane protein